MKIALVHEMLIKLGGAEKVLENWIGLFPEADVFTLIYDEKQVGNIFPIQKIHPQVFRSSTQRIYTWTKKQRLCLPFMAHCIESFDFSNYDVVLVSSSGFAHGVVTKPETKTIVYYHAPARYLRDWTNEYKRDIRAQNGIKSYILNSLFLKLRIWGYIASKRHDTTFANSITTQKRLKKYFRIESEILYPPIETERFSRNISTQKSQEILQEIPKKLSQYETSAPKSSEKSLGEILKKSNYYVVISTLTEFKRIDIAIKKFPSDTDVELLIIGDGGSKKSLEEIAGKNIYFLGKQFGDNLVYLVQNSLGLIFPGEEDFGIVPVEVMAAGKPIFALQRGGLTETVLEGYTGEFFQDTEGNDFTSKFQLFHKNNLESKYKPENCKHQAQKFDKKYFEERIIESIR